MDILDNGKILRSIVYLFSVLIWILPYEYGTKFKDPVLNASMEGQALYGAIETISEEFYFCHAQPSLGRAQ